MSALSARPSTGYLPEVIRRYRMARRGVELTLLELPTVEQIGALKEGRIAVGFGRIAFDDPLIQQFFLHDDKICAALARRHALRCAPAHFGSRSWRATRSSSFRGRCDRATPTRRWRFSAQMG